jgi:CrcB protein
VIYVLASVGGALGALARWAVGRGLPHSAGSWPWSTLLVNLTGCLLLGALFAVLAARVPEPSWVRPFVGVGVLGGYTTYSTFAVEIVDLTRTGAVVAAVGYLLLSVVGGVLAVALGAVAARRLVGEAHP